MTHPVNSPTERKNEHEAAWNLLPWYLNGTLDGAEANEVREHLTRCVACRDEAGEQEVIRAYIAEGDSRPERAPAAFSALIDRIGEEADAPARRSMWPAAIRLAAVLATGLGIWSIVALQGMAPVDTQGNEFTMLSDEAACAGDLSVVFDPSATETAIRELLVGESLEIACGPTADSLYKLRVVDAGSSLEDLDDVVARVGEYEIVELALPSSGG